jgi:MFS family permease
MGAIASAETGPSQVLPGARKALALLLAINLFNYIDRYILAAVLPKIRETMLGGDANADQKLGWLATAFLLSYMIASPIFGWLADRFSRWFLVGCGVILWSIASGESGRADVFIVLLITRMFVGVGEAAYGPAAPTIISDLYPVEKRGQVMSWFYMAIPVGSAIGYGWGGLWAETHWRWAFYSVVIPGLLLGVLCFLMPDPRKQAAIKVEKRRAKFSDYLALLKTKSYVLNCLGMAALTFAIGGISHWMPTYVADFRKAGSLDKVNMIFGGITVVAGISATLLGGIVGDRLRGRVRGAYFIVSAVGLAMCFPLFLLMLITPFPFAWVFVFLAEFFLFFNTGPSNTALANVSHPSVRASAFAMNILFIHALGDAISPPIIGGLTDKFGGNMNVGFAVVGAMMVLGAIFWWIGARYLDEDTKRAESFA